MFFKPELPDDFILGTATASYQVEGAGKEDGRTSCIWDDFAKVPGAVYNAQDGSVAADQYHRYKEDISLMSSLGFKYYRFSQGPAKRRHSRQFQRHRVLQKPLP